MSSSSLFEAIGLGPLLRWAAADPLGACLLVLVAIPIGFAWALFWVQVIAMILDDLGVLPE